MERVEELLLNFALNWGAGRFSRPPLRVDRRPHPYRHDKGGSSGQQPATQERQRTASCVFITDGYLQFVQWLRGARVVVVRPELPDDFFFMQHRLGQRDVQVEALERNAETGVLMWPRQLSNNVVGIFSDPNIVRALPARSIVMALLPATAPVLQEVRSWHTKNMNRLDLLWAQNSRFRDFIRRNMDRTNIKTALTPQHFLFLSQWMLVELDVDQQKSAQWYWPLPVYALIPTPELSGQPQPQQQQMVPQVPPPPLAWVMPDAGVEGRGLPPPLSASFVISAAEPLFAPSNIPTETIGRAGESPFPTSEWRPTSPPPHEDFPAREGPADQRPWSFSE